MRKYYWEHRLMIWLMKCLMRGENEKKPADRRQKESEFAMISDCGDELWIFKMNTIYVVIGNTSIWDCVRLSVRFFFKTVNKSKSDLKFVKQRHPCEGVICSINTNKQPDICFRFLDHQVASSNERPREWRNDY
jgi:hypothetical protein